MSEFIELLKENIDGLQKEELAIGTCLSKIEAWDSLAVLTLLGLVEEQYGCELSGAAVSQARTIGDLYQLVENAAKVGG